VPKEIDLSEVSVSLKAVQEAISAIPQPEKTDLTALTQAVKQHPLRNRGSLRPFIQQVGVATNATLERLMKEQGRFPACANRDRPQRPHGSPRD